MTLNIKPVVIAAACFIFSAAANCAPVVYDFTASNSFASGVLTGLVPNSTASVTGSFTYDPSAPYIGAGNAGTASVYQPISNYSATLFIPTHIVPGSSPPIIVPPQSLTAFDAAGYAAIANDLYNFANPNVPGGFQEVIGIDLIELYMGPTGGAWTPFSLGGHEVTRIIMGWREAAPPAPGGPDFLNDENLPDFLPTFNGYFSFAVGTSGVNSPATGSISFSRLQLTARPVSVPEPATLALCLLGLLGMQYAMRKHRLFDNAE